MDIFKMFRKKKIEVVEINYNFMIETFLDDYNYNWIC